MLIPHKVKNKGKYISFHYLRGWKARKIRKVQEISPQIPILIIHGDMDNLAPLYMAKEIYNSCKSSKEIYIVHGAGHAENYKKDPEGYEKIITTFIKERVP